MQKEHFIYGYEEYKTRLLYPSVCTDSSLSVYQYKDYLLSTDYIIIGKEDLNKYGNVDYSKIKNHEELLNTAKTLYIHPSCSLPRTMLQQKYKKALNPWTADAVVIPNTITISGCCDKYAIFINEDAKKLFLLGTIWSMADNKYFRKFPRGTKFADMRMSNDYPNLNLSYTMDELLNSRYEYYGPMKSLLNNELFYADLKMGSIPASKTVFEDSVVKSLNSEDNKPTTENYINIGEMLQSTDNDTVAAGLKALASMDYINFPNSTLTILRASLEEWKYNKAVSSTAVKYMLKALDIRGKNYRYLDYKDRFITQEDFELTKNLLNHFYKDSDCMYYLSNASFVFMDEYLNVTPRLK